MVQLSALTGNAEKIYKKVMGIPLPKDENESIISDLRAINDRIAKSESIFNELTDSDLIDYASYNILAEKARYTYLLKQAKEKKLHF